MYQALCKKKHVPYFIKSSQQPYEISIIIFPIFQVKKLRLRACLRAHS